MIRMQQAQLFGTKVVGSGMFSVSAIHLGFTLGAGLTAGPVGWIALGFCGITLAGLAHSKSENPHKNLLGYDPLRHRKITTNFYNFFSGIGKVGGFYNTEEEFSESRRSPVSQTDLRIVSRHSRSDTAFSRASLNLNPLSPGSQKSR